MESFLRSIDLRCPDNDPELFAIALAIRHIRWFIDYDGCDIGRPDNDSAQHEASASTSERNMVERANIIAGSTRPGKK